MLKINAYLLDNYYVFTNYDDLASHIHDVVHFSKSKFQNSSHVFSVITGKVQWSMMVFINDQGESIPIKYEQEYDFYYSVLHEVDYQAL